MRPNVAGLKRHGFTLWMMLCGFAAPAWSADGHPPPLDGMPASRMPSGGGSLLDFDISAQPLAAALNQYAYLTKQPVVYPGNLAVGRMASAVTGRFTMEAALQMLLQGTGLTVEKLRTRAGDTFTLSESAGRDVPRGGTSALLETPRGFHGLVQARVLQALCARAGTAPGDYSALLRFKLDDEGRVRNAHLLDATGDPRRDAAILHALGQLQIQRLPQAVADQSLTMAILPRGRDAKPQCPPDAQAS